MMDKMNVHGMPARRLVWVDADMYIRENIDELCELPRDVRLAAAINSAGGSPSYVWPSRFNAKRLKCIRSYNTSADREKYTFLRPEGFRPLLADCPYMLNCGMLVVDPLSTRDFNEQMIQPMQGASIHSYDGSDQGIVNTLLYGERRLWGNRWAILHPRFNVVGHSRKHAESKWHGIKGAVIHYTGKSGRPWQTNFSATGQYAEWHAGCSRPNYVYVRPAS